jgi:hypothetical protein
VAGTHEGQVYWAMGDSTVTAAVTRLSP